MAEWKGQSRGGALGHQIFIWLLKNAGLKAAYTLLAFVAVYFIPFAPKGTKSSWFYFRKIHKQSVFKACINIYRNYFAFGQAIIDRVAVLSGIKTNFTFEFDGEENIQRMVDEQTGGILISAHLGNWDIAGHFLGRINGKVNVIMYDQEHEKLKEMMNDVQVEKKKVTNVNIIPLKDDLSHVLLLNQAVERKELLCVQGDRVPPGSKNFEFEFMGRQAEFPTGPFYLAAKYKIPVSFVFALKEGSNHYHLYATPPKFYEIKGSPIQRNEGIRLIIEDYIKNLETKMQRYPLQWFNFYKFWK